MDAFRAGGHEPVNVFPVDDRYVFKHYFEGEAVFARIREFYAAQHYRFEVPSDRFEEIRSFLAGHGYGLVVVDPLEPFVVVVRQYTAHPDGLFKSSVCQRREGAFNFFLLTDQAAVDRAVDGGATRLTDTQLDHPF